MKLAHATEYAIRVIVESSSETVPMCEVVIAGVATKAVLEGAILKAALKWDDYVVLFISNDVPFEDSLNIYLLDRRLNVLDSASMYAAYSTGIFSNLDLSQADIVRFHFLGEGTWTLKLFPKKQFAIPGLYSPLGVHRPFAFFRRFQLSVRSDG